MNALDHAAAIAAAVTTLEVARRNVADEALTWRRTDRVAIWDEDAHQDATARLRDSVDRFTDAFDAWLTATREPTRRMVTKLGPEYGDMFDREIGGLVENELDVIRAEDLPLSADDVIGILGPLIPRSLVDNRVAEVNRRGGASL